MRHPGVGRLIDILVGAIGVGIFVYGDIVTNRTVQVWGVIVITICVVAGAIMAAFRQDGH